MERKRTRSICWVLVCLGVLLAGSITTGTAHATDNNQPGAVPNSFKQNESEPVTHIPDNSTPPADPTGVAPPPATNQGDKAYIYIDYEEVGGRKIYAQSTIEGYHGQVLDLRKYVTPQVTYKHVGFNPDSGYVTFDSKRRNTGKIIYEKDYKPAVDSQVYPKPNQPGQTTSTPTTQPSGTPASGQPEGGTATVSLTKAQGMKLINGYPDGSMRPRNPVTREEVAALFYKLMDPQSKSAISTATFYDGEVAPDSWSYEAVSKMVSGNVMKNRTLWQFKPKSNATRAEVAAVVVAFIPPDGTTANNSFPDVTADAQAISVVAARGYMKGYPDGTFRPEGQITRAELIVVLNKLMGRTGMPIESPVNFTDVSPSDWFYMEVQGAVQGH